MWIDSEGRARAIILEPTAGRIHDVAAARELADRIAASLSDRQHPDGASLIREVRDR